MQSVKTIDYFYSAIKVGFFIPRVETVYQEDLSAASVRHRNRYTIYTRRSTRNWVWLPICAWAVNFLARNLTFWCM